MNAEQARAIYELMMITSWADGRLDMPETLMTESVIAEVPELLDVPDKQQVAASARDRLQRLGLRPALKEVAAALGEAGHRELAFVCCARVLEADGIIAQEEFMVLLELRTIFGLRSEDVARLLRKP